MSYRADLDTAVVKRKVLSLPGIELWSSGQMPANYGMNSNHQANGHSLYGVSSSHRANSQLLYGVLVIGPIASHLFDGVSSSYRTNN
jgi:hypothetical protein